MCSKADRYGLIPGLDKTVEGQDAYYVRQAEQPRLQEEKLRLPDLLYHLQREAGQGDGGQDGRQEDQQE